jgi:hypothetical protein
VPTIPSHNERLNTIDGGTRGHSTSIANDGVNPTLTLVANSRRLELKRSEVGAPDFRKGHSVGPGCDSQQVDSCCGDDVLQMGLGQTAVSCAS